MGFFYDHRESGPRFNVSFERLLFDSIVSPLIYREVRTTQIHTQPCLASVGNRSWTAEWHGCIIHYKHHKVNSPKPSTVITWHECIVLTCKRLSNCKRATWMHFYFARFIIASKSGRNEDSLLNKDWDDPRSAPLNWLTKANSAREKRVLYVVIQCDVWPALKSRRL